MERKDAEPDITGSFPEPEVSTESEVREVGPAGVVRRIARVGARYGFGFVFRSRLTPSRGADLGRVGVRLRRSFEDLGPTYVELGRYLAARGDIISPDIADELGRERLPVRPMPFSEVRELLERELHSDLFRLFVSVEDAPHRSGPLTQSHRAVLPGGRPALVVVRRGGLRRDLLAMRPVAELVRRRLESRLTLDPSETVADFTAQVNHRRDMYFAAQTSRRVRDAGEPDASEVADELRGGPLRERLYVPKVYRSHSASRCITFEFPSDAISELTAENALRAAKLSVELALTEGIFFADLVRERLSVDGSGRIWLTDPTEVFSLDPERMRGLAEVFAAARREDVDGVSRALSLAGSSVPRDDLALRRELREALGLLGGPLWGEHTLAAMRRTVTEALRRGGVRLQPEVALLLDSLVAAEKLCFEGDDPRRTSNLEVDQPLTVATVRAAGELVQESRDPVKIATRTAQKIARPDLYSEYPRQIHDLLTELQDGEVEVRFRHGGLDQLVSKVDILANRLVFAALIAALIIGSSMLGTFVDTGVQVLGVSIFGFVGFTLAAVMGVLLLVGIIRSGRL
ncbi:AarF/UbiB family protein [Rubrobacter indicoceani]|uniref:AarF/UbiB family protein n=1 Tax=Rubrobacter indicoceani TaxID=2051957 RepID=UPI000E5A995D|nr:AarF/UbiB family protein [Rubrobacter indicoceani]